MGCSGGREVRYARGVRLAFAALATAFGAGWALYEKAFCFTSQGFLTVFASGLFAVSPGRGSCLFACVDVTQHTAHKTTLTLSLFFSFFLLLSPSFLNPIRLFSDEVFLKKMVKSDCCLRKRADLTSMPHLFR